MLSNTKNMTLRKEKNQGMNWISQHKRLAIYLRDGLACCYCGDSIMEDAKLTGEQIIAHIDDCLKRDLNIPQAKELIARQGSCFKALKAL
jgi:hypothetical protein